MTTHQEMIREFHDASGHTSNAEYEPGAKLETFRYNLIMEEVDELTDAQNKTEYLDALADIVYLCYGAAITFGMNLDAALKEVHRSNMTKVVDGDLEYRADGKIMKPASYEPPMLDAFV